MAISVIGGDISTTDNVTVVGGVSWPGHAAGTFAALLWALLNTATPTLDSEFTAYDTDDDQNLRAILGVRLPADMTGTESGTVTMTTVTTNRMAAALVLLDGVERIGAVVNVTEAGTAVSEHPFGVAYAGQLTITPEEDSSYILLFYAERSSTGNVGADMLSPLGPGDVPSEILRERGTGGSGGAYACIAGLQLGGSTAGIPQVFTQWDAPPANLASNAEMWLMELVTATTDVALNFGVASETDTAPPLAVSKALGLGQASETDTARSLAWSKALPLGLAGDTETAPPLALSKVLQFGIATETDSAPAATFDTTTPVDLPLGTPTEADTARPLTLAKTLTLGRASDVETALAISMSKVLQFGCATEISTAPPMALAKHLELGLAVEVDEALAWSTAGAYSPALLPTAATRPIAGTAVTRPLAGTAVSRDLNGAAATREEQT